MYQKILLIIGLFPLCINSVTAQTNEEAEKMFPGVDVVYTNYDKRLTFSKKDGVPVAESEINMDMLMLTDKNSNMVNRYRVHHSGNSELTELQAYTRVPAGNNKYKTVKVQDIQESGSNYSSIFYDDSKVSTFNFPALTQFAIAHLNYTLKHKDAHMLSPYFIPDELPVMNSTFTVVVPRGIYINYLVKNDPKNLFEFSQESRQRETIYKWTIRNAKPDDNYQTAPDFRYYTPHIIIYVTGYDNGSVKIPFLGNLDDLYQWNYSFTKEINLKTDPGLKALTDSLTNGTVDELVKADRIYKWVQGHIKYIAFEDGLEGFRPRNAADIYNKRYGDCKDMASILTNMLGMAGLSAHYTWIGTRDLPYKYSETPLPIVDNHMISTINVGDKWFFLDATNPFATLELPPSSIQGKEALVSISEKEYKILTVPVSNAEENLMEDSTFLTLSADGIKGIEKVNYHGYFGQDVYTSINYKNEKEKEDYVKTRMGKGSNKFILGKFSINKINPTNNLANISAEFEIPDYSKKIGNDYFINLNLEKLMENQVVDIDKRKVPIEHEFKYIIRESHILEIPENYTVGHIPEDFTVDNDLVRVTIRYRIVNKRIIATQEVINKTLMILPSDFAKWNQPMKSIIPKYKESIILEKTK